MIRKQYNDIAHLYDLLAEGDDGMIWFRHNLQGILKSLPEGARLLDCSCGTGNHVIWLAKQGFDVHASDISEMMIQVADEKAKKENLRINFFQSSWKELPAKTDNKFDLVVCPGNSLSHLDSLKMLEDAFDSFKKILKPGGIFFFDIRNWEKTYRERSLQDQEFKVKAKDGLYDVRYSYDMPDWNEKGLMHVDIRLADTDNFKRFSFNFFPVRYKQFHDAAVKAGFENVKRGYFPGKDYYFMVCRTR